MPSGQSLHAEAIRFYKERNLLSQKDIVSRMGFTSVRSVQRFRKKYGLNPKSFWGLNPLFELADVEEAERRAEKERMARLRSAKRIAHCKLISVKQARRRAGRKARK